MSPDRLVARCPAKVNLLLRVLGRRPDGYHELDTVFQAIDLWDTLEIRPADELSLSCDDPELPTDRTNLVLQAAEMLRDRHAPGRAGAALRLGKAIPLRSGLGGGSSDAAGALLLCARFWGVDPGAEALGRMGAELGADVPFFLVGGTARGRGRGDRIEVLPAAAERRLILGIPPFGIATREVFGRVSRRLTPPSNGVSFPHLSAHKWPGEKDFGFMANDLEAVVFESWPELRSFRDALLEAGARVALLSGSGSTVYGILPEDGGRKGAMRQLRARFENWRIVATRTVERGAFVVPSEGRAGGG